MEPDLAPSVPTSPDTDAAAIAAVLGGDTGRFAILVRRHNQVLFRACRAVLHDDAEAEDAVQVAWVSAYRALASFRAEASFRAWIIRIAVNEASSRLRRRRRFEIVPLEDTTMSAADDPARDLLSEELGRMLERQIDALPDGMRTVLVLRDVIELDTAETAACLGIGEEAVRVRLHRARHAVARSISETVHELVDRAAPSVWRFDGDRCARVLARVMAEIERPPG